MPAMGFCRRRSERRIRAVTPNLMPDVIGDLRVKLGPVHPTPLTGHRSLAARWNSRGTHERVDRAPARTGAVGQIQPPGKKLMNAADWARGRTADPPHGQHDPRPRKPAPPAAGPGASCGLCTLRAVTPTPTRTGKRLRCWPNAVSAVATPRSPPSDIQHLPARGLLGRGHRCGRRAAPPQAIDPVPLDRCGSAPTTAARGRRTRRSVDHRRG